MLQRAESSEKYQTVKTSDLSEKPKRILPASMRNPQKAAASSFERKPMLMEIIKSGVPS